MVQISVTATAVSGSPIPKSRRTARARSTNSVMASDSVPSATPSGETPSTASASMPSGSRDVARTLTLAERPVIISIAAPAAFSRCSQLSMTSSSPPARSGGARAYPGRPAVSASVTNATIALATTSAARLGK